MNILLVGINTKYIHTNLAIRILKQYAAPRCSSRIETAEYTINQYTDDILRDIYLKKPDMIGFSCYLWNITFVQVLMDALKKVLPNCVLFVGGPETSFDSADVLARTKADFVIRGEGEIPFTQAVLALEKNQSLELIPGITWRSSTGDIVQNPDPSAPIDMADVPFVYTKEELPAHQIVYYEATRGCPFSCQYCLSGHNSRVRFRPLAQVYHDLSFFLSENVPQVKFVDRTFNCSREYAMAIWTYLREHDNGITNFHFEMAAELIDQEMITWLANARPGLFQFEIGVQSTNPETLKAVKRITLPDKLTPVITALKQPQNIHLHLDLIAGLPFEGYNRFKESFNYVYSLSPDQLQLGFLKLLKGSYMHEKAEDYECVCKGKEPYEVLKTKWLSYGEVCRLKGIEDMVEVYYNSGQFSHTMKAVERHFCNVFSMYEALADFYEQKGYQGISHSRIRRYEILMEFLEEQKVENICYFKELMILDLYARENLKTRPMWVADRKPYKEKIQEFYKKEAETPEFLQDYTGYQPKQLEKMTHLEIFSYNVLGEKAEKGIYPVLFDYKKRSPLTNDAAMYAVSL